MKIKHKKYKIPSELRTQLQKSKCFEVNNVNGILQVTEDWLVIGVAIALSLLAWQTLPWLLAAVCYCFSILTIGARQRALRVNNHCASHNALAKNKSLNYLLGAPFGAWLCLESYSGYDHTHNSKAEGHHHNTGTVNDVDHMAIVNQGLYGNGCTSQNFLDFLWTIPLKTPNYVKFLLLNRIWNEHEDSKERYIRLIYVALLSAVITAVGGGQILILYWIVPLLTTANWIGSFIQIAEHYPLLKDKDSNKLDIEISRNRILNPLWSFFFSCHNEGLHLVHHLYPRMSFSKLKQAHQILMQDKSYAALHQEVGMKNLVLQMTPK